MEKRMDTYLFKTEDIGAFRIVNGKYKKDENNVAVQYDKASVVDTVSKFINDDRIIKGTKIDNKKNNYISYSFKYSVETEDKILKCTYRIKIPKKYLEENKIYINRLDALVKSAVSIKKLNTIKNIFLGTLAVVTTSTFVVGALLHEEPVEQQQVQEFNYNQDNLTKTRQDFLDETGLTLEQLYEWNPGLEESENKNLH